MSQLILSGVSIPLIAPIDLEVAAGECITLTGPSGCGKTLLLRAIADLDPHQGEIRLDSVRQHDTPPPQWRHQVGFLPAESHWWADRVGEHFDGAALNWLERLGFTPVWLERELTRLSSGERQRLALVRLLSGDPKVLLLDEPTANLDSGNARQVEQLITEYRNQQEAAVIWVTHDPEQQRRVGGRHFHIHQGRLEPVA